MESLLNPVTEYETDMLCMDCSDPIDNYKFYGTKILAMSEFGIPIEEIVCQACFSI